MPQTLPWVLATLSLALLAIAAALWAWRRRAPRPQALPAEWGLSARPVFTPDERRAYRHLREALPHHVVLSKLPLVRFCQPADPQEVAYWYELLGGIHVTFAICSGSGRVLAAIDLDTDRGSSRRSVQIKQSVLAACRIRYLRCPIDHLPSVPELQLLLPHSLAGARGPLPAPTTGAPTSRSMGSRGRATLWQESGFFQDSFFGDDGRASAPAPSDFGELRGEVGGATPFPDADAFASRASPLRP
ncbi:MAG: DUF2726 domain-containing protein [Rubrivivax sp.]|jgi:hypothetical protein|nr:DUF2726 domain-containing protein [Rubrivivax sp.]